MSTNRVKLKPHCSTQLPFPWTKPSDSSRSHGFESIDSRTISNSVALDSGKATATTTAMFKCSISARNGGREQRRTHHSTTSLGPVTNNGLPSPGPRNEPTEKSTSPRRSHHRHSPNNHLINQLIYYFIYLSFAFVVVVVLVHADLGKLMDEVCFEQRKQETKS